VKNIFRFKKVFVPAVVLVCIVLSLSGITAYAEDNVVGGYRGVVESLDGIATIRDAITVKDENGNDKVMSQIYYPEEGVGLGDGDTLCLSQDSLSNVILFDGNIPGAYVSMKGASLRVSASEYRLIQGVMLIEAINDIAVTSKTQTLRLNSGDVALLHVDGYGNAFNYCIEGSVDIQSTGKKNATLIEGEYVAVTVKRDLKEIRPYGNDEIKDITMPQKGPEYISSIENPISMVALDVTELEKMQVITLDGKLENGVIEGLHTNTLYLVSASSTIGHTVYVDFKPDEARVITLTSLLDIDKDSYKSKRALKAYVDQAMSPGDELYIYITTADEGVEALTLKYDKNRTIYERSYQLFKSLLLPAGIAFVLLIIVLVITNKKKKTALEWEESVKREAHKNK